MMDVHFQIDKKITQDNLDLLNKPITFGGCIFPLANLNSGESVYYGLMLKFSMTGNLLDVLMEYEISDLTASV
jgi:hypothetical protein